MVRAGARRIQPRVRLPAVGATSASEYQIARAGEPARAAFAGAPVASTSAAGLGAGVPEALSPGGVGVEPAKPRLRGGACPRGGGCRADEAERGARRDRGPGIPPVPARPGPRAVDVNGAMDWTVNGPMDWTVNGPMDRAVNRPLMAGTLNRPMGAARAMGRPMDRSMRGATAGAAATRRNLPDHAAAHLDDRTRSSDDLDRFRLRQTVTAKCEAGDRASG